MKNKFINKVSIALCLGVWMIIVGGKLNHTLWAEPPHYDHSCSDEENAPCSNADNPPPCNSTTESDCLSEPTSWISENKYAKYKSCINEPSNTGCTPDYGVEPSQCGSAKWTWCGWNEDAIPPECFTKEKNVAPEDNHQDCIPLEP